MTSTGSESIEAIGELGRVESVDDLRWTLRLASGKLASVSGQCPFEIGQVLIVDTSTGQTSRVGNELWSPVRQIGTVRRKLDDITIVDIEHSLIIVATTHEPYYDVNNTVLLEDQKIARVISAEPTSTFGSGSVTNSDVQKFLTRPEDLGDLSYSDFGGMAHVVNRAKELIETPIRKKQFLAKIGTDPISGVLLTGAPGTGKTLLARIIASQSGASFYEISGPAITSMWYGQSEELLRKIFTHAQLQERAIIFFDEIDSLAGRRGEVHEASAKLVAQLLVLMDGFNKKGNVVVVATTNRPEDVDPALLRPGRFSWRINFEKPTLADRTEILQRSARSISFHDTVDFAYLAAETDGWSPAELAAIWREAGLYAANDSRGSLRLEDVLVGVQRVEQVRMSTSSTERN